MAFFCNGRSVCFGTSQPWVQNPHFSIHLSHDTWHSLTFWTLGFLIYTMEGPASTSQNEFKVQDKGVKHVTVGSFPPPKPPCQPGTQARLRLYWSGAAGLASKPTPRLLVGFSSL